MRACACGQLRTLNFENNFLSGSVPPSLEECASLRDLYLSLKKNLLEQQEQLLMQIDANRARVGPVHD